jgi:tetratricopeptide (TPR) repeat protein
MEHAQDLVELGYQATGRRVIQIARRALEIHPDCVEAYELLGKSTCDTLRALQHFEQAVRAGERALGPKVFEEDVGHFYGIVATRPYMRARESLAAALIALDRLDEATAHLRDMLRLNPNDNQGIRYPLAACLLALGSDHQRELTQLFKRYDEKTTQWEYAKALAIFAREGNSDLALRARKAALRRNRHVPDLLRDELPPTPTAARRRPSCSSELSRQRWCTSTELLRG